MHVCLFSLGAAMANGSIMLRPNLPLYSSLRLNLPLYSSSNFFCLTLTRFNFHTFKLHILIENIIIFFLVHTYLIIMSSFYNMVHYVNPCLVSVAALRTSWLKMLNYRMSRESEINIARCLFHVEGTMILSVTIIIFKVVQYYTTL